MIASAVVTLALFSSTGYVAVRGLLRAWRARTILARLGPVTSDLERVGQGATFIRGTLGGGEITTGFGGSVRTIEDAHVRARAIASPDRAWVRVGDREVVLRGPVQVVLGSVEERASLSGESVSVRRVRPGDPVVVEGVVKTTSAAEGEAGYRDRAVAYELLPVPDPSWPGRPITIYGARGRAAPAYALLALFSLGSVVAFSFATARARHERTVAVVTPPTRPPCAGPIAELLDRNDPFSAKALVATCDDDLSRAEVAFMLGEVDAAAIAYRAYRAAHPGAPLTLSEVEAVAMRDPGSGSDMVRLMKREWYRGPADSAQENLDCIIKALESGSGAVCIDGRYARLFTRASYESVHGLPNYALHEPFAYVRFLPVVGNRTEACTSMYPGLAELARITCQENIGAATALFDAIVDSPALEDELALTDRLHEALMAIRRHVPELAAGDPNRLDFEGELGRLSYDAERALAVGAAAAWFAHDEARFERYLPYIEAHARAIFTEHLALVEGKAKAPDPSHSPSDFSDLDMEVFALADNAAPEALVARLKERGYSSAPRLAELLTSRPRDKEAFAKWVRGGFVPVCRTCGIYAVVDATFRRREAARVAGDKDLEEALRGVQRRLGEALVRPATWGPVVSLESLLATKGP